MILPPFLWLMISERLVTRQPPLPSAAVDPRTPQPGSLLEHPVRRAQQRGGNLPCRHDQQPDRGGRHGRDLDGRRGLRRIRVRGFRFSFRRLTLMVFLSTYMVPPIALVIPLYLILVRLHLLDSRARADPGLLLLHHAVRPVDPERHFRAIPRDLEDAARIDGCTRIGALFRVILPLASPGLLATALFAFLLAWDEFLYALIFTSTAQARRSRSRSPSSPGDTRPTSGWWRPEGSWRRSHRCSSRCCSSATSSADWTSGAVKG